MWQCSELGKAWWVDSGRTWQFDAIGGSAGMAVHRQGHPRSRLQLLASEGEQMPMVAEQFVRGDQWHLYYPQDDAHYSLEVAFRPIRSDESQLLLECTVSLQTTLLESHPTIDLIVEGIASPQSAGDTKPSIRGCSPITMVQSGEARTAVFLGPHDYPFTRDQTDRSRLRFELFGEFLEKGVIRKARPWCLMKEAQDPLTIEQANQIYRELVASPLPLS